MKTSARNQFKGTVRELIKGPVSAEVTISVAPGVESRRDRSARALLMGSGSRSASRVHALIKASSVVIATD